jgi:hypothetical protein
MTFPQHARQQIQAVIESVPPDLAHDVCLMELFMTLEEFDERRPFIQVSWNTNEHLARMRANSDPSWDARVEWDSQDFLAYKVAEIGESAKDPEGAALRRRWIEHDLNAWYSDAEEESDPEDAIDKNILIHDQMLDLLVDIVDDLHSSGLIKRAFGQPVPVLIDSFEPHDPITELNHKANPPELHAVLDRLMRKE